MMMFPKNYLAFFLFAVLIKAQPFYYSELGLTPEAIHCSQSLTIAVLDDAFDLEHPNLIPFYQTNGGDTLINGLDENADGFVDNPIGYDFADKDGDPRAPEGFEKKFHHGNLILGEMVSIWTHLYGEKASECFKIIPIKVFTSEGPLPIFRNVDEAIELLAKLQPDMVLTSWVMGALTDKVKQAIDKVLKADLLWVASAGNFSTYLPNYPAAVKGIVAVGAVDQKKVLLETSNYGSWVDVVNFGVNNIGYVDPNIYEGLLEVQIDGQTSSAAAISLAMLAALKAEFANKSNADIVKAFYQGSHPIKNQNAYRSQVRWGIPNLQSSRALLNDKPYLQTDHLNAGFVSQGRFFEAQNLDTLKLSHWEFQKNKNLEDTLKIFRKEGIYGSSTLKNWFKIKDEIKIPLNEDLWVEYTGKSSLVYQVLPVDSSQIWCNSLVELDSKKGFISDGSLKEGNDYKYAPFSDCKWLIKAPDSMRVLIRFKHFDSELNADPLYLFAGKETMQTQLFAKLSGNELPPQIISPSNEVLIWFLSDAQNEKTGWSLEYEMVDSTQYKPSFVAPK